jgi:hypothetical protein
MLIKVLESLERLCKIIIEKKEYTSENKKTNLLLENGFIIVCWNQKKVSILTIAIELSVRRIP